MDDAVLLTDHVIHLTDQLAMRALVAGDSFWTEKARPELATGRLLSVFSYERTWDVQERHPSGDELAYVLAGDVDLLLDRGTGERAVRLRAGFAGIVPAGDWHRLAVHEPCTVMFITPVPAETEHRRCDAG